MVPRTTLLVCLIALVLAAVLPAAVHSAGHARSATALVALEDGILGELNSVRAKHGLKPLRLNRGLTTAARQHTFAMLADGFFEHESVGGGEFSVRIQRFYSRKANAHWSVGENLIWGSGNLDAARAVDVWMNSHGHRENILEPRWKEIGIGAVFSATSKGEYGGRPVTIITTDFGVRA